ncbi:hypothetical protein [Dactylosporangium sp. NPDC000521]|uniref:hypothetical protein n=1 Tax=Dactylosporangium sp. NPDC000521 TaxID=3363975 RepID=UPI003679BD5D
MISRLAQSLSFEVHHRSHRRMTAVLSTVARALRCEFTPVEHPDLADASSATLFGMHVLLGALTSEGAGTTYVLRGETSGLTGQHTEYIDLSPHVAGLLVHGAGHWEPARDGRA